MTDLKDDEPDKWLKIFVIAGVLAALVFAVLVMYDLRS
jgi:hypothetical protein